MKRFSKTDWTSVLALAGCLLSWSTAEANFGGGLGEGSLYTNTTPICHYLDRGINDFQSGKRDTYVIADPKIKTLADIDHITFGVDLPYTSCQANPKSIPCTDQDNTTNWCVERVEMSVAGYKLYDHSESDGCLSVGNGLSGMRTIDKFQLRYDDDWGLTTAELEELMEYLDFGADGMPTVQPPMIVFKGEYLARVIEAFAADGMARTNKDCVNDLYCGYDRGAQAFFADSSDTNCDLGGCPSKSERRPSPWVEVKKKGSDQISVDIEVQIENGTFDPGDCVGTDCGTFYTKLAHGSVEVDLEFPCIETARVLDDEDKVRNLPYCDALPSPPEKGCYHPTSFVGFNAGFDGEILCGPQEDGGSAPSWCGDDAELIESIFSQEVRVAGQPQMDAEGGLLAHLVDGLCSILGPLAYLSGCNADAVFTRKLDEHLDTSLLNMTFLSGLEGCPVMAIEDDGTVKLDLRELDSCPDWAENPACGFGLSGSGLAPGGEGGEGGDGGGWTLPGGLKSEDKDDGGGKTDGRVAFTSKSSDDNSGAKFDTPAILTIAPQPPNNPWVFDAATTDDSISVFQAFLVKGSDSSDSKKATTTKKTTTSTTTKQTSPTKTLTTKDSSTIQVGGTFTAGPSPTNSGKWKMGEIDDAVVSVCAAMRWCSPDFDPRVLGTNMLMDLASADLSDPDPDLADDLLNSTAFMNGCVAEHFSFSSSPLSKAIALQQWADAVGGELADTSPSSCAKSFDGIESLIPVPGIVLTVTTGNTNVADQFPFVNFRADTNISASERNPGNLGCAHIEDYDLEPADIPKCENGFNVNGQDCGSEAGFACADIRDLNAYYGFWEPEMHPNGDFSTFHRCGADVHTGKEMVCVAEFFPGAGASNVGGVCRFCGTAPLGESTAEYTMQGCPVDFGPNPSECPQDYALGVDGKCWNVFTGKPEWECDAECGELYGISGYCYHGGAWRSWMENNDPISNEAYYDATKGGGSYYTESICADWIGCDMYGADCAAKGMACSYDECVVECDNNADCSPFGGYPLQYPAGFVCTASQTCMLP